MNLGNDAVTSSKVSYSMRYTSSRNHPAQASCELCPTSAQNPVLAHLSLAAQSFAALGCDAASRLVRNLGLDELGEEGQRLLPPEVTSLGRNHLGNSFLHDGDFSAARHLLQRHGALHFPRQVRVVELVGVANALVRHELEISSPEGMAFAAVEVRERHPVRSADLGVELMHFTGETVRRQPLSHRVRI